MKTVKTVDRYLEDRIAKYDKWLKNNQISYSSKVIPVSESFHTQQWVLPTEQVIDVLRKADSIAIQNCECRTHYKRCDNPLEVCLLLDDRAKKLIKAGKARQIDLRKAIENLKKANECGLVHLTLFMPDHKIFALCSCCPCCCHDLQIVKRYERKELMVRSEYEADMRTENCINCGECVDRCIFGARVIQDDHMKYDENNCLGCGLCVTSCPVEAISMKLLNTSK